MHQIAQAALAGQGIALARMPLIADALANGDLVEILPDMRLDTPLQYWRIMGPRAGQRPEIVAFCEWLDEQAAVTRLAIGESGDAPLPDPSSVAARKPVLSRSAPARRR